MSVRGFSEMTYYSALALGELGQAGKAKKLLGELLAYAAAASEVGGEDRLLRHVAADDAAIRRRYPVPPGDDRPVPPSASPVGARPNAKAKSLMKEVLKRDPDHAWAADLREDL